MDHISDTQLGMTGDEAMTMIDSAATATAEGRMPALYRLAGVTRTYRQKGRVVNARSRPGTS
jgi:putative ABC transport system ATP-binding protein